MIFMFLGGAFFGFCAGCAAARAWMDVVAWQNNSYTTDEDLPNNVIQLKKEWMI